MSCRKLYIKARLLQEWLISRLGGVSRADLSLAVNHAVIPLRAEVSRLKALLDESDSPEDVLRRINGDRTMLRAEHTAIMTKSLPGIPEAPDWHISLWLGRTESSIQSYRSRQRQQNKKNAFRLTKAVKAGKQVL